MLALPIRHNARESRQADEGSVAVSRDGGCFFQPREDLLARDS